MTLPEHDTVLSQLYDLLASQGFDGLAEAQPPVVGRHEPMVTHVEAVELEHPDGPVEQPHVEDGLPVAVLAGHLDLFDAVGELHEPRRAFEQSRTEIASQAVADHW